MSLTHSTPSIITDGLVLCLDAANRRSYPGSGTTWYDLSGNGYHGTLTSGPTFNSVNLGNIVFDGTDDYIDLNYEPVFTGDFHISFNIKFNTYQTYQNIISSMDNGGASNGFWIEFGSARGFTLYNTNISLALTDNIVNLENLSTGVPYNVRVNRNANFLTLHVNNILCGSSTYSNTIGKIGRKLLIAKYAPGTNTWIFNGSMSNLLIYNRSLSANEVTQNFNALRRRFGI